MGGEKVYRPTADPNNRGSPPRRRGKVLHAGFEGILRRITPAWAGKSMPDMTAVTADKDHPRMGGEKAIDAIRQQ